MSSDASICPGLVIGVVGHRPDALRDPDDKRLLHQVRSVLAIACDSGRAVSLISPVAEGADRLVAREALASGLPLICLLPFSRDDYARDFETEKSRADYEDLLQRSAAVIELPGTHGSAEERDAAYAALSDELIDRIDLLIAIWDGEEARGLGGTGHTVQSALERCIPVVWIHAHTPHEAALLCSDETGAAKRTDVSQIRVWLQKRQSIS
ncbi:MAG: hypothetical protein WBW04_21755 [Nitrolancea sp.]